ncbi:MAG: radical SAM/SPASM domain-containing protein [Anaerolineaceae bacterium]
MLVLARAVHVHVPAVDVNHFKNLMEIKTNFSSLFKKTPAAEAPASGVYHFLRETVEEKNRVHLRIDPDGSGTLIVNANRIFHLNPTASLMAYFSLSQVDEDAALGFVQKKFQVSKIQAKTDFSQLKTDLDQLISPFTCPICDLEIETTAPFSATPTAPYRMDLALTYRCNNSCAHCYNARPRNYPELSTQEWFKILDNLWKLGIPHIVFTGGEPTLRDDLPELIQHAEANGQITGLNTNGRKLKDANYVHKLVDAGLDHVQITLESHLKEIHDQMVCQAGAWEETVAGLKNALSSKLYVMTNSTMLKLNSPQIAETLEFLGKLGLKTIGLNALIYSGRGKTVGTGLSEQELFPLLEQAKIITNKYAQRLIWYTPTQYCNFDPVQMELGVKGCTAALYNMCIEPDGSVIPCQSYYQSLGKIQTDSWDTIWNHPLSQQLRSRKSLPDKCNSCLLIQECGGGCPLTFSEEDFSNN